MASNSDFQSFTFDKYRSHSILKFSTLFVSLYCNPHQEAPICENVSNLSSLPQTPPALEGSPA